MTSQRYSNFHTPSSSPPVTNQSSPFRSCQSLSGTESPAFHSPRSSPVDELLGRENEDVSETPLITHDDHYGSMSLVFRGSSANFELEKTSLWRRISDASKKGKPYFLFLLALTFSVFFVLKDEVSDTPHLIAISNSSTEYLKLNGAGNDVVTVVVSGPFVNEDEGPVCPEHNLTISLINMRNNVVTQEGKPFSIGINCSSTTSEIDENPISVEWRRNLKLEENNNVTHMMLLLASNTSYPIAISLKYYVEQFSITDQVTVAFVILIGVYILIIFELVHRTIAAMLGSLAALAFLSFIGKRPSLSTIVTWVQWDTLVLLFGMMILVALSAKTGFFDYLAFKAYKLSKGRVWWLITLLCISTAVISAFLDNVTVILLSTPVTVTLCQVLNLNPTPILIAEVIFSNIGGTATAIGDPPNVILVSNKQLKAKDINFTDFTRNLILGICFCFVVAYAVLRLLYRNVKIVNDDPPVIEELKREVEIWKRSAERLPVVSAEEKTVKLLLMQKVMSLENTIRSMKRAISREDAFQRSLEELERKYVIRDRELLAKSSFIIIAVITLFFIQSFVSGLYLDVGWIAVLGCLLLILLADISHFEDLMEKVEWTTLVFFAALFILMQSLDELGLLDYLGDQTSTLIENLGGSYTDPEKDETEYKLAIALIVIVWVSALVSSFIDNIPFTTAMIPVILDLNQKNQLPLKPLVWALAMGSCLGGNGTLIGASANVVCAGLAEQCGYPITFNDFFKVGFLVMLATTATATIYLLISQVILNGF